MGKWTDMPFGIDISRYDEKIDIEGLKGNLDFLICKMGGSESQGAPYKDIKFDQHVQLAYDLDIPCGAYWFVGPRTYLEIPMTPGNLASCSNEDHPVLGPFLDALRAGTWFKKVHFLAFDIEEPSLWTTGGQVSDVWLALYISDMRERLVNLMRNNAMPTMPIIVYSRRSFIDSVETPTSQRAISTFLENHPEIGIWMADWRFNSFNGLVGMDVMKTKRPYETAQPWSFGYSVNRPKTWQFWQFSGDSGLVMKTSSITAGGKPIGIDCDLYNGTKAELHKWCNFVPKGGTTPPPDPEPEPDPAVPAELLSLVTENNKLLKEIRSKFS